MIYVITFFCPYLSDKDEFESTIYIYIYIIIVINSIAFVIFHIIYITLFVDLYDTNEISKVNQFFL